jgi:hypothetical protein
VEMREKGKGMGQDGAEWKTYGGRWRILEMGQCGVRREPPIPDPPPPPPPFVKGRMARGVRNPTLTADLRRSDLGR